MLRFKYSGGTQDATAAAINAKTACKAVHGKSLNLNRLMCNQHINYPTRPKDNIFGLVLSTFFIDGLPPPQKLPRVPIALIQFLKDIAPLKGKRLGFLL